MLQNHFCYGLIYIYIYNLAESKGICFLFNDISHLPSKIYLSILLWILQLCLFNTLYYVLLHMLPVFVHVLRVFVHVLCVFVHVLHQLTCVCTCVSLYMCCVHLAFIHSFIHFVSFTFQVVVWVDPLDGTSEYTQG